MKKWIIPYTIAEQEFVDFNEYHLRRTPAGKKSVLRLRVMFVVAVAVFLPLVFIMDTHVSVKLVQVAGLAVIALIAWFLIIPYLLFTAKRTAKKKRKPDESLFSRSGQLIFDFEDRTITDIGEISELKIPFQNISVCYETEGMFYFYFRENGAVLLPFRLFSNASALAEFSELVHQSFHCER